MAILQPRMANPNFERRPTLLLVMKSPVTQVDDRSSEQCRWDEGADGDTAGYQWHIQSSNDFLRCSLVMKSPVTQVDDRSSAQCRGT